MFKPPLNSSKGDFLPYNVDGCSEQGLQDVESAPQEEEPTIEDAIDIEAAETVDRPPSINEGIRPSKIYEPFSFPVLALLAPASIFGVLARLGLVALATYDGESIFPLAYVQALGCFIMGFGLRLKEQFGQFYGPLYTALTTGFCGSLTTFSSWQFDVFSSWINISDFRRAGLRDFIDGLGKTVFTLTLSLGSLLFGYSIASMLVPHIPAPRFLRRRYRYSLSVIAVLSYAAVFPAYFRLPKDFRPQATAALLFAYPGTLTRYTLSVLLNQRLKAFPLGTFTANSLGTALLGAFHVLQSLHHPLSPNTCAILQGLIDGYCGCLTTVSTFAAETRDLKSWKAWRYVLLSWMMGQGLLLLIMGSSLWAGPVSKEITCR
ncbi:CrcB-like protein-domain-containing protein [Crucibulum laeve]|uniref:CrcB-like protein-domain-containing protein n=1 Tax=Crucibulum laeve TaxID=68775 RepID=A0A5C3MFR2_9AGAR|nr:CrcB-like protein-domain-containing protein [Crucibulum laeve]